MVMKRSRSKNVCWNVLICINYFGNIIGKIWRQYVPSPQLVFELWMFVKSKCILCRTSMQRVMTVTALMTSLKKPWCSATSTTLPQTTDSAIVIIGVPSNVGYVEKCHRYLQGFLKNGTLYKIWKISNFCQYCWIKRIWPSAYVILPHIDQIFISFQNIVIFRIVAGIPF